MMMLDPPGATDPSACRIAALSASHDSALIKSCAQTEQTGASQPSVKSFHSDGTTVFLSLLYQRRCEQGVLLLAQPGALAHWSLSSEASQLAAQEPVLWCSSEPRAAMLLSLLVGLWPASGLALVTICVYMYMALSD